MSGVTLTVFYQPISVYGPRCREHDISADHAANLIHRALPEGHSTHLILGLEVCYKESQNRVIVDCKATPAIAFKDA